MAVPEQVAALLSEPRNAIIAGVRRSGAPHVSPNWFHFDGEKFYVSTTRSRAKYAIFRRDPRGVVLVDDSTGFRYVEMPVSVEVREDLASQLPLFRAIREKMGVKVPPDQEFLAALTSEGRVLLALTPQGPPDTWTVHGLD